MNIAICLIAYNRLHSLQRLLSSLEGAIYPLDVPLYISVDKSDNDVVERFALGYQWKYGPKQVILHDYNLGLKQHVLSCGKLLEQHEALVVLEDDIFVAPGFMLYAMQAAEAFAQWDDIAGISLYNFPVNYHSCQPFVPCKEKSDVYLMQNAQSWGQVWLRQQWQEFVTWYERNSETFGPLSHLPSSICGWSDKSWLKYHTRYCIEQDKNFVYPYQSYSTCFSEKGDHVKESSPLFQSPLSMSTDLSLNAMPTVRYDCYFENLSICEWLDIPEKDLCIDYYGDNGNKEHRRYWLSRCLMPYKVVRSFGLRLRPYELNVKYGTEGTDFFLYDTTQTAECDYSPECHKRQFFYLYQTAYVDTKPLEWAVNHYREKITGQERQANELRHQLKIKSRRCCIQAAVAILLLILLLFKILL